MAADSGVATGTNSTVEGAEEQACLETAGAGAGVTGELRRGVTDAGLMRGRARARPIRPWMAGSDLRRASAAAASTSTRERVAEAGLAGRPPWAQKDSWNGQPQEVAVARLPCLPGRSE
jgi:hypothetical protein